MNFNFLGLKLSFVIYFLIVSMGSIYGQKNEPKTVAYHKAYDTEQWEEASKLLEDIINGFTQESEWDSVLYYSDQMGLLGEKSGDLELEIKGRINALGVRRFFNSDTEFVQNENRKIFALLDTNRLNPQFISTIYQGHQNFYHHLNKIDSAILMGEKAVHFADMDGDISIMALCRVNLAANLALGDRYGEAIQMLLKSEGMADDGFIEEVVQIRMYLQLGQILIKIEDFEKAKFYLEKAKILAEEKKFDSFSIDVDLMMGRLLYKQNKYDEALRIYNRSLEYYTSKKIASRRFHILLDIAYLHSSKMDALAFNETIAEIKKIKPKLSNELKLLSGFVALNEGNTSRAKEFIDDLNRAKFIKDKHFKTLNKLEFKYYEAIGQPQKALDKFVIYTELQDSIDKSNQSLIAQRIENEFNRKQQDAEISALNQVNQAQDKALAIRNTALIMGSIMVLILGGMLFWLYQLYRKNRKNQIQLSEQNRLISDALAKNSMLLKEIHHRVKNNLQVVSSLLSMQERKVTDEDTRDALKSSKTRVQSMSILHQNLYQGENLKEIEARKYIDQLTDNIKDTYEVHSDIKFVIDIDEIELDVDILIPIGLIINELITNAIKYAFEGREAGEINISLKDSEEMIILSVSDNGIGLPSAELPNNPGSLGARLVKSFAQRLDGQLAVNNVNGTEVKIIFDKKNLFPKS